jgi:hypothetical protein
MNCPICRHHNADENLCGDNMFYNCKICGKFILTGTAEEILEAKLDQIPLLRPILSHYISRTHRNETAPVISSDIIRELSREPHLPNPVEQSENLLLWIADEIQNPGQHLSIDANSISAIIGAHNDVGVEFIVDSMIEQGLLKKANHEDQEFFTLTFDGWKRIDQLRKKTKDGSRAFMAMSFKNPALDNLFTEYLKPAVKSTGFELIRLDEDPPAGLMDERLRVEIRRAAFLVADLTDQNLGAYWEAGFAEGLGKAVIYMCEKKVFDQKKTHFDTNHHHTILWGDSKPEDVANALKATIRATLPHLARMSDD